MNPALSSRTASEDDIARRARAIWAARGCPAGCDVEIWLEAEREITAALPPEPAKSTRRARTSTAISAKGVRQPAPADPIDDRELNERLDDFGVPPRRSPTSVDLT